MGRDDESVAEAREAVEVDPVSSSARNFLGYMLVDAGRIDEAIEEDLKTLEIDPIQANLASTHGRLSDSYRSKRMNREALEEHIKLLQALGVSAPDIARERKTYAENGPNGETVPASDSDRRMECMRVARPQAPQRRFS